MLFIRRAYERRDSGLALRIFYVDIIGETLIRLFLIPFFMSRPAAAAQAYGPAPLVGAAGAQAAGGEGIPTRAATIVKILGIVAVAAIPAA